MFLPIFMNFEQEMIIQHVLEGSQAKNVKTFLSEDFKKALRDPAKKRLDVPDEWYNKGVRRNVLVSGRISHEGEILCIVPEGYEVGTAQALENSALFDTVNYPINFSVGVAPYRSELGLVRRCRFAFANRDRERYVIMDEGTDSLFARDFPVLKEIIMGEVHLSTNIFNQFFGFVWPWEQKH